MTRAVHFRSTWVSPKHWAPTLAEIRRTVADAIGASSLVTLPWLRKPLAAGLREATRGWGSSEVENAAIPAASWCSLQGTLLQSGAEAALRPEFATVHARFSRIVRPGALGLERRGCWRSRFASKLRRLQCKANKFFAIPGRLRVGWAGCRMPASEGA